MFSAARITALRKSKGLSQEVLAEQSGVSLRTIQRVEQGDSVPRGHTVQALAAALNVPLDDLRDAPEPAETKAPPAPSLAAPAPPALRHDPEFLQLLNLSALSFLLLPLLNLVVPWLLWRTRHQVAHAADLGRRVLGFQVLWQVGCFFAFLLAVGCQMVAKRYFHTALPGLYFAVLGLTYAANALTLAYYQLQLRRGRLDLYRFRL
ncbi:helix-turn-helix transcriptional regulator [Hymenobacter sp. BT770]|uniref:helix-turn-helix domain-containing protein n=1 Tax=Hymenobacter sp. BT770 TaxID=2886942 RepID=UPI001D1189B3|nr:helix-turn-helix transcriptional regulator [Hymenobacter sp. BT770]MCC3154188.1 helix-turn-helix domain-containing protein [Hymenobacter sp. BT770]MDO3414365.1 helix-turn-helix transcriptional regulator [Hymenobacter sp. BT770]